MGDLCGVRLFGALPKLFCARVCPSGPLARLRSWKYARALEGFDSDSDVEAFEEVSDTIDPDSDPEPHGVKSVSSENLEHGSEDSGPKDGRLLGISSTILDPSGETLFNLN